MQVQVLIKSWILLMLMRFKDVIRQDLHLDDADGVECLPNEEIFADVARMGYEKPPRKLTFYKALFFGQWKFLTHTLVQYVSAKRTAWNEFSCSMTSVVICLATKEEFEVPTAPNLPSPTPTPHATPPQVKPSTPLASPPQEQPTTTSESSMSHLTTLMETCAQEKGKEVREEEEEVKVFRFQEVKKGWGKMKAIDADEDITLVDVETQVDMDVELQGRIDQDVSAATKDVSAAEPTIFDDEENMDGYMMEHFRGMTYEKVRPIFKREYKKVQTLFKPDKDVEEPKKKRVAKVTLLQESFKKLKAVEVSGSDSTQETPSNNLKEMSEEDVQNMLEIVLVSEFEVEALQVSLVKEKFSSTVPNVDKEKTLWVELKRLFEPDADDVLWKFQRINDAGLSITPVGLRLMLLGKVDTAAEVTKEITLSELILIFCPKVEMSRDVLTVGSTMRISLLYQGEYSQWVERFMNYLEEQTDGEVMINLIKNGDQPLPRVTQVSIAGTTSTEQPLLKDKSMCNKTAKDLWDALARHMLGSTYGEQDRKAAILYEYETFKATEGELLLDTYIRYLQVINDLKKCGYSKDIYLNDAMRSKKKIVVVTSDPLALIAEKTNVSRSKEKVVASSDSEGIEADDFRHFAKDYKKAKVKDYEYYKTKMLLAKKDKDEQVLLAEDQAWMESSSDSNQEINGNMVFMAQIEKVLSYSEASSSSANEKISE
nr:hypothetical protein [Tanacetum cinerariifolium]